eukprot:COSAG02_NODE_29895_length_561_cov_0.584416_1_plen_166_part_01
MLSMEIRVVHERYHPWHPTRGEGRLIAERRSKQAAVTHRKSLVCCAAASRAQTVDIRRVQLSDLQRERPRAFATEHPVSGAGKRSAAANAGIPRPPQEGYHQPQIRSRTGTFQCVSRHGRIPARTGAAVVSSSLFLVGIPLFSRVARCPLARALVLAACSGRRHRR